MLTFNYAIICNVCADSGDFNWDPKLQECMMRGSIARVCAWDFVLLLLGTRSPDQAFRLPREKPYRVADFTKFWAKNTSQKS